MEPELNRSVSEKNLKRAEMPFVKVNGKSRFMFIKSDFLSVSVNKADGTFIAVKETSPRAKP